MIVAAEAGNTMSRFFRNNSITLAIEIPKFIIERGRC